MVRMLNALAKSVLLVSAALLLAACPGSETPGGDGSGSEGYGTQALGEGADSLPTPEEFEPPPGPTQPEATPAAPTTMEDVVRTLMLPGANLTVLEERKYDVAFSRNSRLDFPLRVVNTGTRTISAIRGYVLYFDNFDKEIMREQLTFDVTLEPGRQVDLQLSQPITEFMGPEYQSKFVSYLAEQKKLSNDFLPTAVAFADGSSFSIPPTEL